MSRVGKLPVAVPESVNVDIAGAEVAVKGAKGELKTKFTNFVSIKKEDGQIIVAPINNSKKARALWGTTRSVIENMVTGVSEGYKKSLEINGVGFKAQVAGPLLKLSLGFSHEIYYKIPANIEVKVEKNVIHISGFDKQLVGQVAAQIRELRKPEPYKGKGVKYVDEYIRRKEGKKK